MRQREHLNFRTPQHPSSGTNNWGGASPLLARNIPNESLDQRYSNLNSTRTCDTIFQAEDQDYIIKQLLPESFAPAYELPPLTPARRGVLFKLLFGEKENIVVFGSDSKKRRRWFRRWDPKNRWPQGWC